MSHQEENENSSSTQDEVRVAADIAADGFVDNSEPDPPFDRNILIESPRYAISCLSDMPINVRIKRYNEILQEAGVSDNMYYRGFAKIALSRKELISVMTLFSGGCKAETAESIGKFFSMYPHTPSNSIFRAVRFDGGEAKIKVRSDIHPDEREKEFKRIKVKIRKCMIQIVKGHF